LRWIFTIAANNRQDCFQHRNDRLVYLEATSGGFPLVGDRLKSELEASGARFERGKPGPRKLAE
jgi:hypothetical protein